MKKFTYIFLLCLVCMFCGCSSEKIRTDAHQWSLSVKISDVYGLGTGESGDGEGISTKISYSGDYGEHSEFELGDYFGLFVLDASDNIRVKNLKVYCSGLDNQGQTVWSIFKKGASDDHTSNYPISDILSKGVGYFAYYPYDKKTGKKEHRVYLKKSEKDLAKLLWQKKEWHEKLGLYSSELRILEATSRSLLKIADRKSEIIRRRMNLATLHDMELLAMHDEWQNEEYEKTA